MRNAISKIALALALAMPLGAAGCPGQQPPASAGSVAAEAELDKAYAELSVLRGRVTAARVGGSLVVGSPAALRIAADLRAASAALTKRDTVAARAAMARIEDELR